MGMLVLKSFLEINIDFLTYPPSLDVLSANINLGKEVLGKDVFIEHALNINNVNNPLQRLSIREIQYDELFPDLFLISHISDGFDLYADYLEKKALRMGYTQEDLTSFFPTESKNFINSNFNKVDYSNSVFYKGEVYNMTN